MHINNILFEIIETEICGNMIFTFFDQILDSLPKILRDLLHINKT